MALLCSDKGTGSIGEHRLDGKLSVDAVVGGLPRWLSGKESTCQCRGLRFHPWVGKIPWRRKCEGERVIAPEPWEGTLASRRVEEGLSRSFPG